MTRIDRLSIIRERRAWTGVLAEEGGHDLKSSLSPIHPATFDSEQQP
ncbi:hypothetical protein JOD24_002244 [Kroppenstedtia sanguinis]